MGSIEPFNRLVKLAARAFYDDISTKGENQTKTGRGDNSGVAVVILDALTRRQWVRDEDLAKDLKLHTKQLRRTLRFFEEEKLITRDQRKETAKGAKIYRHTGREGDEKPKLLTHSYCCLDYAQIHDVVRYRLHRMKKKLKDELESKNTVQEYICPNCNKRYTALDALCLISPNDEYFRCESCQGVLVAESDKFAAQESGDGDDNAKRRRQEKLKDMLANMEVQLNPLMDQLGRVKDLIVPDFGTLQAWELRANAAGGGANGDFSGNDPSKYSLGGTPMPYVGETKVEVAFTGGDEKGDIESLTSTPSKVVPPWMRKKCMNLTEKQLGETETDAETEGDGKTKLEISEDKKSTVNDEDKHIQDEYVKAVKAYYADLFGQQHKQEGTGKNQGSSNASTSNGFERKVGMKAKHEHDYDGDDVDWEETPNGGNISGHINVDLNVEADAEASEDDEDEIEWEEG